ncbi:MAG TPA: Dyp-type peroxidase [Kofleriaceae bacterium]|nr:Dyp-type peroxidase [Kofleriaceae bacterium]
MLELTDIQSGVLRPRPTPYAAKYLVLRIDDPRSGRQLMRRAAEIVASAAHPESPDVDAWISAAVTFSGLKALAVPQDSLASFPPEFQEGMAARASILGDTGDNAPEHWEKPLGTPEVHVIFTALAENEERLAVRVDRARRAYGALGGVEEIWTLDCHVRPGEREAFGYRDGIGHPAIEGSGIPGSNPYERPIKPGELILGYPNEIDIPTPIPRPEVLGKNGSYVAFRKLHQRVAAFRQYLKANAENPEAEELLAAKIVGRWRSGAPLALASEKDDRELGADRMRNNAFLYYEDDKIGYKTPPGSHIRRMNPRDAIKDSGTKVELRRMVRRGTSYGPELPEGVLEDDGVERGLMFVFIGADLRRQFEFVQATWLNHSEFISGGPQRDPVAGTRSEPGDLTIPKRPIRRRLSGLPQFVVTRGGEYCFLPSLRALRWLGELQS